MSIYISVVSHGHAKLIEELLCLHKLCHEFHVILKSNTPGESFDELTNQSNFHFLDLNYGCGFGHNNNIVFDFCTKNLNMSNDDYFIVLNPDVVITASEINRLVELMDQDNAVIASINLYKDTNFQIYDNSIRNFPSLLNFAGSFLGLKNTSIINKDELLDPCYIDWAAGSFLCFKSHHYLKLRGFDERYFMYCEDVDICYRSRNLGFPVTYYPSVKATHLAKHENRKILSKHFYWHLFSAARFLLTKAKVTKVRSLLKY